MINVNCNYSLSELVTRTSHCEISQIIALGNSSAHVSGSTTSKGILTDTYRPNWSLNGIVEGIIKYLINLSSRFKRKNLSVEEN